MNDLRKSNLEANAVAYGDIFGEMVALSRSLGMSVRILSGGHPG